MNNEIYDKFLKNDISLETFLSLNFSKIDNNKFIQLQNEAKDLKSIDKIVEYAKDIPSCMLYEAVFANKYSSAGNYKKAVEWAFKAMEVLPKWDPISCVNVFNTLAWNHYLNKNYEEAKIWCLIGLDYDPFYPYLIGTLCEICIALGEYEKAESYYKWLYNSNFSKYCWGNYKSNPDFKDVEPYSPDINNIHNISDKDLFKVLVSQKYFKKRPEHLKQTNLTLALIAADKHETALLVCQNIIAQGDYDVQNKLIENELKNHIPKNRVTKITSKKGAYNLDYNNKINEIKKYEKSKDIEYLRHFVYDPVYEISMYACKALLDLGVKDELNFYLKLAKEWEDR